MLSVEDLMHQSDDLLLACKYLVLLQVSFKVFVRDEAITVDVHVPKHLVESRFAIKCFVLDLNQQTAQPFQIIVV